MMHVIRQLCALFFVVIFTGACACAKKSDRPGCEDRFTVLAGTGTIGYSDAVEARTGMLAFPLDVACVQSPQDVAFSPELRDCIFIADSVNHRIRAITTDGKLITVAGDGWVDKLGRGRSRDAVDPLKGSLDEPRSLALFGDGTLFVVELGAGRIRRLDARGLFTLVADTQSAAEWADSKRDTPSALPQTQFINNFHPVAIAATPDLSLYIADLFQCSAYQINALGQIEATIPLQTIQQLAGIVCVPQGNPFAGSIIVSDAAAHKVYRIDRLDAHQGKLNGNDTTQVNVTLLAGDGFRAPNNTDGRYVDHKDARQGSLNMPRGLAVNAKGELFIADSQNNRIRCVRTDGSLVTIAGSDALSSGNDPLKAFLSMPHGIKVALDGSLIVADTAHHRICRIVTDNAP